MVKGKRVINVNLEGGGEDIRCKPGEWRGARVQTML